MHQNGKKDYVSIDSVRDFRELTDIKIAAGVSGLFMIGGGVPKNFAQDTVVCAEMLGKRSPYTPPCRSIELLEGYAESFRVLRFRLWK